MIKRRIPMNFDFDVHEVMTAIHNIVPNAEVTIRSNGIVTIDATLTAQQRQQLKEAITPLLTDVSSIIE